MEIKIRYSKHALEQINERNISKKMIRKTLLNPEQIIIGKNKRKIAQSVYDIKGKKFLLRVIFVEKEDCLEVITTYLTTKIDKYWRINWCILGMMKT